MYGIWYIAKQYVNMGLNDCKVCFVCFACANNNLTHTKRILQATIEYPFCFQIRIVPPFIRPQSLTIAPVFGKRCGRARVLCITRTVPAVSLFYRVSDSSLQV